MEIKMEACILLETCSGMVNLIVLVVWFMLCIPGVLYLIGLYFDHKGIKQRYEQRLEEHNEIIKRLSDKK